MAENNCGKVVIAKCGSRWSVAYSKSSVASEPSSACPSSSVPVTSSSVAPTSSSATAASSSVQGIWSVARRWTVALTFIAMLAVCHAYEEEQRFAIEPQDKSETIGSPLVVLPCRVVNKVGTVQWTKDDFGLGTHRNLSGFERYSMIGSDEEGNYSLEIRDLALEDEGKYQCQVSSGLNGEPGIRSQYAYLTVTVAPDPPRITQGAFMEVTEGQPVDIECVSEGGKPASEIIWKIGSKVIKDSPRKTDLMPDGQRYRTSSVLRLTPTKQDHNRTITCHAHNIADRASRVASILIEVRYAPEVKLTITSGAQDRGKIKEGSEVRFLCQVEANPLPQMYLWYINDTPVIGDFYEEMIIFNVTRKHKGAVVKCEVSNTVGIRDRTVSLDVIYPPVFRREPKDIAANLGDKVTLNCDVDSQPPAEITWLLHEKGHTEVKGRAPDLKITVSYSNAGLYICKAKVDGYPEVTREATVFINAAPKITSNRTQFGMEGEMVTIECAAISVPQPDYISWSFEGREIKSIESPEYATLRESLPDGVVKSSLVIKASQGKHFGTYNCSFTNGYGSDNVVIVLKPLKTLPLFIILIGVTSGIIIFSAFVILLIVCHRRRRQTGQKMSEKPDVTVTTGDMYKESDRSSNISDLKPQIHQSDGSYDLDYTSSDRSDIKMPAGIPLSGPVPLPNLRHEDQLMQFRYSNDYSDPAYSIDPYYKNPAGYVYDYPQGYIPPPNLRVQSPTQLEVPPNNRSLQGSLTRSIDTASTLPLSAGNGSQNNSLQRAKSPEEDAINHLGLPLDGDPPLPVYAQPNAKTQGGVDLRYAATYGNPYLRNNSLGYGSQVHTAKPAATPAPPPYSAVRSSVVMPSGNGNQPAQATHV